jgi:hypothetical protein
MIIERHYQLIMLAVVLHNTLIIKRLSGFADSFIDSLENGNVLA